MADDSTHGVMSMHENDITKNCGTTFALHYWNLEKRKRESAPIVPIETLQCGHDSIHTNCGPSTSIAIIKTWSRKLTNVFFKTQMTPEYLQHSLLLRAWVQETNTLINSYSK